MLQAKTKEQEEFVLGNIYGNAEIINDSKTLYVEMEDDYYSFVIDFDTMAKIVDYLRKENEEVEIPTFCRVSKEFDGSLQYDLRDTPHDEVIQFCKKLAWVKGNSFDDYYEQYVKTGKIRL